MLKTFNRINITIMENTINNNKRENDAMREKKNSYKIITFI